MTQLTQTTIFDQTPAQRTIDLHVISDPRSPSSQFCALAARALRCRRCWITLAGADAGMLTEGIVGLPIQFVRSWKTQSSRGIAQNCTHVNEVISTPLALPDGTTGRVMAAEREDGEPFDQTDLSLLEQLVAFYVSSLAAPARRDVLRLRNDLRTVREQAILTEERERQRLSREMHDDLGHVLTTAILSVDMKAQLIQDEIDAREAVAAARQALVDCTDRLHEFAFQLRPAILSDLGLAPALRSLARRAGETSAVSVSFTTHGPERRFREDIELAAFRIMQEALTNALKYARATRVTIEMTVTDTGLELELSDNGVGFEIRSAERAGGRYGQGLVGMHERAEMIGGILELHSEVGSGTSVWVRFPLESGRGGKS